MANPATGSSPAAILAALVETLKRRGITQYALTGAIALGVWTRPRSTNDIDVCAVLPEAAIDPLLALHDGMRVGPERIPAIVRIRLLGWDVDLFSSRSEYDLACLERATPAVVEGVEIKVVSPEDLVIHKLHKLKDDRRKLLQDAADLKAIAEARGDALDEAWLRRWLEPTEADFVLRLRTLADSELVQWLSSR